MGAFSRCRTKRKRHPKKHSNKKMNHVLIYGKNGKRTVPIKTDPKGRPMVKCSKLKRPSCWKKRRSFRIPNNFRSDVLFSEEKIENIHVSSSIALPSQDTSHQLVYSYAIVNKGDYPVKAVVQISPDNSHFARDGDDVIPAGKTKALVPNRFLRFTRLVLSPTAEGHPTTVDVYFQTQTNGRKIH
ncbi:DUF6385 domain-containing protein [Desmospora activa]|uniref:DUF6385 domain-containing protein n=1 Tax=Desmospora activa DSM 45169 TaxID=1121389 RepID=A0A2T4Z715_9BACL|nr:DUF6385 domain-containing protein [Desmospora activa]PTM57674.1 hypothetical protein C8J48_0225 [Desmospora activa DSM 45169]